MGGTLTPSGTTTTTSSRLTVAFFFTSRDVFLLSFLDGVPLFLLDSRSDSTETSLSVGIGLNSPSDSPVALRFFTILPPFDELLVGGGSVWVCGEASLSLQNWLDEASVFGGEGRSVRVCGEGRIAGIGGTGGFLSLKTSESSFFASASLYSRSDTRLVNFFCFWRSFFDGDLYSVGVLGGARESGAGVGVSKTAFDAR